MSDLWFVDSLNLKLQTYSEPVNGTKSPLGSLISQARAEDKTYEHCAINVLCSQIAISKWVFHITHKHLKKATLLPVLVYAESSKGLLTLTVWEICMALCPLAFSLLMFPMAFN